MFIKLRSDQVMEYWNYIRDCLVESLPPYISEKSNNLLQVQENLLVSKMECWLGMKESQTYAVVITQIVKDECAGEVNLLLFSLNVLYEQDQNIWKEGLDHFKKYAKSKNCNQVIAYSNKDEVKSLVRMLGGNTDWSVLMFNLDSV